jgi:hypothetical protein
MDEQDWSVSDWAFTLGLQKTATQDNRLRIG